MIKDFNINTLFLRRSKFFSKSLIPVKNERKTKGPRVLEINEGRTRIVAIRIDDFEFNNRLLIFFEETTKSGIKLTKKGAIKELA